MTISITFILQKIVRENYWNELAEVKKMPDPEQRRRLEDSLQTTLQFGMWRIREFAPTFAEVEEKGPTSQMYRMMLDLLLDERGRITEAMTCVSNQRDSIFRNATASKDPAHTERNRFYLLPLLQLAVLHDIRGETNKANGLYNEILAAQPDWPEALHQKVQSLYAQGLATFEEAPENEFKLLCSESLRLAQKLNQVAPSNPRWIRDLALIHELLAGVAHHKEKFAESEANYRRILSLGKSISARDLTEEWLLILGMSKNNLGVINFHQGKSELAAQSYAEGLDSYLKLYALDTTQTWVALNLAGNYFRIAHIAEIRGHLELAKMSYEQGLTITRKQKIETLKSSSWQKIHISSLQGLGGVAVDQGKLPDADKFYREALAAALMQSKAEPDDPGWKSRALELHHKLGSICVKQGKLSAASKHYQQALDAAQLWLSQEPKNADWKLAVITSQGKMVEIQVAQDKLDEATLAFRDSHQLTQRLAADPSSAARRDELKQSYRTLGELAQEQGKEEEALQAHLASQQMAMTDAEKFPENFYRQREVCLSYGQLARTQNSLEKWEAAIETYHKQLSLARKLVLQDPTNYLVQRDVFVSLIKLGEIYKDREVFTEAEKCYQEALLLARKFAAQDTTNFVSQRDVVISLRGLAKIEMTKKQPREAVPTLKECLETANRLTSRDPSNLSWQLDSFYVFHQTAQVHELLGEQAEALGYLEKAMVISDKLHKADPTNANWQEYAQTTRKIVEMARKKLQSRSGERAI